MKTGPFKLRSGNKPSIAKLSGISPVKQTDSEEIKRLKQEASNREKAYKRQVGDGSPESSKTGAVQEMQRQSNIYDRQRGKKVTYANAWKGMGIVARDKHNNDYDTFVKAAKKYNKD